MSSHIIFLSLISLAFCRRPLVLVKDALPQCYALGQNAAELVGRFVAMYAMSTDVMLLLQVVYIVAGGSERKVQRTVKYTTHGAGADILCYARQEIARTRRNSQTLCTLFCAENRASCGQRETNVFAGTVMTVTL